MGAFLKAAGAAAAVSFLLGIASPPALATTSVTSVDPELYTCNQPESVDFEGLPDRTDLSQSTFPGVEFTTTDGFTWLIGDFATGSYNGKHPSGSYTSQGTHWGWLGENQGRGIIDMTLGRAKVVSLLVSSNVPIYLEAYSDAGDLLETAGPSTANTDTGTMSELKISRSQRDIGAVVVHDSGNYFLVDELCTDAPGVGALDVDQDGLPDDWERNGADTDQDGDIDVDLPAMGANPMHKDLFVEVDWLTGSGRSIGPFTVGSFDAKPSTAAMNRVVEAFNSWPVPNPGDEPQGIHLHLDAGPGTIKDPVTGSKWGSDSRATAIPDGKRWPDWGGTWNQLDTFRSENVPKGRRGIFHYVVFLDEIKCKDGRCITGKSRGIPGHDLVIAKGDKGVSTDLQESVTLAHELGHNLGLGHGGRARGDDPSSQFVNNKANYLSIMNYYYSNKGLVTSGGADGVLTLSPQESAPLERDALQEVVGIDPDPFAHLRVYYKCASDGNSFDKSKSHFGDAWAGVDWDCDGNIGDGGSNAYLQDPSTLCTNCSDAEPSVIRSSEDYHHLEFWGVGQGWDADNEAMVDVDQAGTEEPTIEQAKEDGVWWPSKALVLEAAPDVAVASGTGIVAVPISVRHEGDTAVTYRPRLKAPGGVSLSTSDPVTIDPAAEQALELDVDTAGLTAGSSLPVTLELVDQSDDSVLTTGATTLRVVDVGATSCDAARRALQDPLTPSEQLPAIRAIVDRCGTLQAPAASGPGTTGGGGQATGAGGTGPATGPGGGATTRFALGGLQVHYKRRARRVTVRFNSSTSGVAHIRLQRRSGGRWRTIRTTERFNLRPGANRRRLKLRPGQFRRFRLVLLGAGVPGQTHTVSKPFRIPR